MKKNHFNYEKAMQALLYVITEIQNAGLHQTFKTLYFAEKEYMRDYGRTILGETYIKMVHGPAPSHVYDLVKMANNTYQGHWLGWAGKEYAKANLSVIDDGALLKPLCAPNLDYLAEAEKEYLDLAIERYGRLSYEDRKNISHDDAWEAATLDRPMDIFKIARAGGASDEAIEYLRESIDNSHYYAL